MGDFIYNGDATDIYRRQRENGGFSAFYDDDEDYYEKVQEDSIFKKEVKHFYNNLDFKRPFSCIEEIFTLIEKENGGSSFNPIALVLSLKFSLDLFNFTELDFPLQRLIEFLNEQWKYIHDEIRKKGMKKFEEIYKNSKTKEDIVKYKIYKNNIKVDNNGRNLDRYISIWKKQSYLYNDRNNENKEENSSIIKEELYPIISSEMNINDYYYVENIRVKVNEANLSTWLDSVYFIVFSNPILKHIIISSELFLFEEDQTYLNDLMKQLWVESHYRILYHSLKKIRMDMDSKSSNEFSLTGIHPKIILNLMFEIININQEDVVFSFQTTRCDSEILSYSNFNEYVIKKPIFAIVKGIQYKDRLKYVSFRKKEDWILFDGTIGGCLHPPKSYSNKDVYDYGEINIEYIFIYIIKK